MEPSDHNPFFTIVLPTFNRAELLPRSVGSVLQQSFTNWELILIDDGSVDNTKMVAKSLMEEDARIRYTYQQNQGRGGVRNTGIDRASGRYITFLDDDDYYLPGHLQSIYNAIEREQFPVAMIRSEASYLQGDQLSPILEMPPQRAAAIRYLWLHGVSPMFFAFHREVLQYFRFDPHFPIGQDFHLVMRAILRYPFYRTGERSLVLVEHPGRASHLASAEKLRIAADSRLGIYEDLLENHREQLTEYLSAGLLRKRKSIDLLYLARQAIRLRDIRLGFQYLFAAVRNYADRSILTQVLRILGRLLYDQLAGEKTTTDEQNTP